jgi:hypothetical protein
MASNTTNKLRIIRDMEETETGGGDVGREGKRAWRLWDIRIFIYSFWSTQDNWAFAIHGMVCPHPMRR